MSYGTLQIEKMTTESGYSLGAGNASSFKNRIINGAMGVSQYTPTSTSVTLAQAYFVLDRTCGYGTASAGVYTLAQSSTTTTGFQNSLSATVTTADGTLSGSTEYGFRQNIEGLNVYDLEWGTANAKSITISFWVRSSLTGTFAGSVCNSAYNRSYVFTYTINSANTFEYKTITIAGDTSGTWLKTNGVGLRLQFNLGASSSKTTSAGSWAAGYYQNATGSVQTISTNGATFYLTGLQLEVGTVATSFDYRPYGTELALCQRYYWQFSNAVGYTEYDWGLFTAQSATLAYMVFNHPVQMRTFPAATYSGTFRWTQNGGQTTFTPTGVLTTHTTAMFQLNSVSGLGVGTCGRVFLSNGDSGVAAFSAEL